MTRIDVCICTFQRESIKDALKSIANQQVNGAKIRVVIADNDKHAERREKIERAARIFGLNLEYIHAPARNISIARNACLDAARGDWIAFIDDDEIAAPTWIGQLLDQSDGRDIVFGVSQAIYGQETPKWIARADLHSNRIEKRGAPWNGYTANVLISGLFLRQSELRFDEALGQTGGEDTLFFFEAMKAGARFGYAPGAIVTEVTSASRANFKWLLLRRFRSGQTHALILDREGNRLIGSALALAKLVWSLAAAAAMVPNPARARQHLLRGALHAGVVAAAARIAPYREYGSSANHSSEGA